MALLLNDNKRTATATALEKSVVIVIYKTAFQDYLAESSIVIRTLIWGLMERLQKTTAQLTETSSLALNICEIFNFLTIHQLDLIEKDQAIKTLSRCFNSPRNVVEEKLDHLVKSNLIEYGVNQGGKPMIKLHKNINYVGEPGEEITF
jgi:CRP-like cAMP-binding protein